jgi:amino acid adenylation domain-containing protein
MKDQSVSGAEMLSSFSQEQRELLSLLLEEQALRAGQIERYPRNASHGALRAPTSWAQQRLWFIDQLETASAVYHIPMAVRLRGDLRRDALQSALHALVQRHEALRTVFVAERGDPQQEIAIAGSFTLQEADLGSLDEAQRDEQVWRHKVAETTEPFDLRMGPLIRGRLLQLGSQEHVLLVTMHHIVSDGWSMEVFIRELGALYAAHCEGREPRLEPLTIQYADYAQWQRQWLQGELLNEQLRYWRERLRGCAPQLELPTDRPRPAVQSYRGDNVPIVLDAQLVRRLRALAQRHGMTLFMVLYAAWAILLSRLSGQTDVLIGTPVANRQRPELEGLIGFFVNTLVLRLQVDESLRVEELLQQVKEVTLGAYDHQDVPFEHVVEALQPQRSLSRNPLFQAMLVLQNTPASGLTLPGLHATLEPDAYAHSKFDLLLSLQERGEQITGSANYATDLFDRETIARWNTCFITLLNAMIADTRVRVGELSILPERELQVLASFNATGVPRAHGKLVHELFEDQVRRTPQVEAVMCGEQSLTYEQLDRRADELAHFLMRKGVGPDTRVALCLERSLEMVVALLGVLKAGGAYVPLDPHYPAQRLQYMLEDASPRVLLTQTPLAATLPRTDAEIVALDSHWDAIAARDENGRALSETPRDPDNLVYVIYTSGSTGRPKGTAMPHRAMVNLIEWHRSVLSMTPGRRVLQFAALGFDVAFQETFSTLCLGGTLVLLDEWVRRDPSALVQLLNEQAVERLFVPPLLLQSLAEHFRSTGAAPRGLRDIITAGEQLRITPEVRSLFAHLPGCRLHNHYGPTETHVVTALTLGENPQTWPTLPSIGRPIANTQIYVLDLQRQPVPIGVTGEIYIGGAGVARGYLERPELTRERFLADPFAAPPQPRVYKTGDLGRWRADGTLEYLGRNDDQVKIRGFRVEIGEIEAQLARHAQVKEAAVVAHEDAAGHRRLVAYVTARDGSEPSVADMREHVSAGLPEFMVPSAFVVLDALPLTPTGKLDRRSLPEPASDAYVTKKYEAPQGELEEQLARIWRELLRADRAGRHDNFFELGGHSLLVVQMLERLREAGLCADVRSMYVSATLADAARTLTREATRQFEVPPNRIPPGCRAITPEMLPLVELDRAQLERIVRAVPGGAANIQDIYPLAPLQEGILFHHLLNEAGADTYSRSILLALSSREKLAELIRALQALIDRHDVLRTAFWWEQLPKPVQIVHRHATLPVQTFLLERDRDALAQLEQRMSPGQEKLDLRTAPLIRLHIAADPRGGRWYAVLQTHHIISDNQSLLVLISELMASMEGRARELPNAAPYRNHVARVCAQARAHDAEAFFRSKLAEVDEPTAPFGLLDVHVDGSGVIDAQQVLEPSVARRIRARARQAGVSAATLFHAAWALVVARTSGRDDVVFGSVLLGRLQAAADGRSTVGMFINTLPLRLRLQDCTAQSLVEQTQRELVELLDHEQASLAVAQRCSGVAPPLPLFSTLLNYLHTGTKLESQFAQAAGVELLASQGGTNYPIMLSVDDQGEGFTLTAQTDRRLQPQRMLDCVSTAMQSLLVALERAPQTQASSLAVLPDAEQRQVIERFNATQVPYPHEKLIHELFEEQVLRTPAAVAVMFEGQSLTYDALNSRANRLARHLQDLGIGPDQLVAICVERSLEMVVGLLAVLKAGGAYVPLEPSYPTQRLQYMLADSAARIVLTQEHLRSKLPPSTARVIALDSESAAIARNDADNLDPRTLQLTSSHLAYVIYTSGSTGQPKGAMNEHRGVVNRLLWMQRQYQLDHDDRVLQKTPFSFDVSVWEFFWPLLSGARLVVARPLGHQDPAYLRSIIEESGVTTIHFVPSMLQIFLDRHRAGECQSLRHIVCSGEELSAALQNKCLRRLPQARLSNLYGPTEAAVDVTSWECRVDDESHRVPIGRPIANIRMYVLDGRQQPVPVGVAGELYIAGVGVGRGYLNRPELTRARFLQDFCSDDPLARMYRTGDLGRWRSDGALEYLGRNDHQVKIRGFRIELEDISVQLANHPRVKEAVVIALEDDSGEKRLVAYVVPANASSDAGIPSVEELRAHLTAVLPDFMVPSAFVLLERLPLSPNGKLDRRALPAPQLAAYTSRQYEAPQGETEEIVADIWRSLLPVERIGREDGFFELGGHSLLAMQAIAHLHSRLRVEVPIRLIFEFPTLQRFAAHLDELRCVRLLDRIAEGGEEMQELLESVTAMPESQAQELLRRFALEGKL